MPTVADITTTALSGLNHIDALLSTGPDWNFQTRLASPNTLTYSFSVSSGLEAGQSGQQAFNAVQQANARAAMQYLSSVTGIRFVESADATAAQVRLCNTDLADPSTTGLCSWQASYGNNGNGQLTSYNAVAYVYLDNREWATSNATLTPGSSGYETLLHELGHMLGLKHPFDGAINLPTTQDNTSYTLMAYTHSGGSYSTYRPDDIAALNWLYGRDGLGGTLGVGSLTGARYLTGTSGADSLAGTAFNDTFAGNGGGDTVNGGAGIDSVLYVGARSAYAVEAAGAGFNVRALAGAPAAGTDALAGIERLAFADANVALDIGGSAGQAYRLYRAAFDRVPDLAGIGYWIGRMDKGSSEQQVASEFIASAEFASLYGSAPATRDFITKLYANVLHRVPDQAGYDYWVGAIDQHGAARADVLVQFSDSNENQAQVIGVISNGIAFTPYTA
jgi:serralysin